MNFEQRMRDLARSIFQYQADNPDSVDWDGRDQVSHFCDEAILLLVADVIATSRKLLTRTYDEDLIQELDNAIDSLDTHYAKDIK